MLLVNKEIQPPAGMASAELPIRFHQHLGQMDGRTSEAQKVCVKMGLYMNLGMMAFDFVELRGSEVICNDSVQVENLVY